MNQYSIDTWYYLASQLVPYHGYSKTLLRHTPILFSTPRRHDEDSQTVDSKGCQKMVDSEKVGDHEASLLDGIKK